MTSDRHAFFHRTDVCAWLLAAALGGLSLSVAAGPLNKGNISRLGVSGSGRSVSLSHGGGANSIPVSNNVGGWTTANNYGVPPAAVPPGQTGTLMSDGKVYFRHPNGHNLGGVNYPLQAQTPIPWEAVGAAGVGIICAIGTAGACAIGGAAAIGLPYMMDWIQRAGLNRDPQTGDVGQPDQAAGQSDGYLWRASHVAAPAYTKGLACDAFFAYERATFPQAHFVNWVNHGVVSGGTYGVCKVTVRNTAAGADLTHTSSLERAGSSSCPAGYWVPANSPNACYATRPTVPVSPAELGNILGGVAPDPRVWGEVLDKGGTIDMPDPTVTGPQSIDGPETVQQHADGSRTVSRDTYNFTTNNNTVVNNSVTNTTTTYNSSNVQTGQTTTTTTRTDSEAAAEQEKEDTCAKHPEILGCQKIDFDTPDGEIPRDTHTVTYQEESLFGAGSCPTDRYLGLSSTGQSLRIVPWSDYCAHLLPIRAVVMALALFGAFLILMPSRGEA